MGGLSLARGAVFPLPYLPRQEDNKTATAALLSLLAIYG
eukprot:gene7631-biopygen14275